MKKSEEYLQGLEPKQQWTLNAAEARHFASLVSDEYKQELIGRLKAKKLGEFKYDGIMSVADYERKAIGMAHDRTIDMIIDLINTPE